MPPFKLLQENEYAHLRLHDFSDAVARLPPEEIHGMAGGEWLLPLSALSGC